MTGMHKCSVRADGNLRHSVCVSAVLMEIGDLVTYNGKSYVLRGLEPMSVPDRRAEIEDPESGECCSVPVAQLVAAGPQSGV